MSHRRLKFEILSKGVSLTRRCSSLLSLDAGANLILDDYPTTSGLVLRLPDGLFVNARLRPGSGIGLDRDESGYHVMCEPPIPVDVFPPPLFAAQNRRLTSGTLVSKVAMSRADRVRLTPIYGCANHCGFCNYPGLVYKRNSLEEMVEALNIALCDAIISPPHVLVSGGTPRGNAEDYTYFNEVCAKLPPMFPHLKFDLMVAPRTLNGEKLTKHEGSKFINAVRNWGFDAVSVNIELNSEEARRRHIPEKDVIGRHAYLEYLECAAVQFPRGKVRSVLLTGLEPEEETLIGVSALAERGVLVELSPFTADPGIHLLAGHPEPGVEEMVSVYEKAMDLTIRRGMSMEPFCIPCSHNIL